MASTAIAFLGAARFGFLGIGSGSGAVSSGSETTGFSSAPVKGFLRGVRVRFGLAAVTVSSDETVAGIKTSGAAASRTGIAVTAVSS